MNEVREQRGLVYGIGTSPAVRDHLGADQRLGADQNEHVKQAIDVTRAEIARFYANGATQAEVNDAITYLTGSFALDLDTDVKIDSVLQSYQVVGRDVDYVNRRNDPHPRRDAGGREPRDPAAVRSGEIYVRRGGTAGWAGGDGYCSSNASTPRRSAIRSVGAPLEPSPLAGEGRWGYGRPTPQNYLGLNPERAPPLPRPLLASSLPPGR